MYYTKQKAVVTDEQLREAIAFSDNLFSQLDKNQKYIASFSTGKDSILLLERCVANGLKPIVYSQYIVDHLSFNDEIFDYYEDKGVKINKIESGITAKMQVSDLLCINKVFKIKSSKINPLSKTEKLIYELEDFAFNLMGIKINDSPNRRLMLNKYGWKQPNTKKAYPVYNFSDKLVFAYMYRNDLPVNKCYEWFGRSQDVINYKHLFPLKEKSPADHERFVFVFPLIEALFWIKERRKKAGNDELMYSENAKRGSLENYNVNLDQYLTLAFDTHSEKEFYAKKYLAEWFDEYVVYLEGRYFNLERKRTEYVSDEVFEKEQGISMLKAAEQFTKRKAENNNVDHFITLYFESIQDKQEACERWGVSKDANCVDGLDFILS